MAFWPIPYLQRRLFHKRRRCTFGIVAAVLLFMWYFIFFAAPSQIEKTSSVNIVDACHCASRETITNNIVKPKEVIIASPVGTVTRERKVEHDSCSSGGILNVHMWSEICGTKVDILRNWPHFPYFPDKRSFISKFYKTQFPHASNNGERIFGFVHPQRSGEHKFAIASDDTSELWLSTNEDPASSEMIARVYSPDGSAWTEEGDYTKYPDQISKEIVLNAGKKYYIESLSKQGSGAAHVAVYWSYRSSTLEVISSKYLSSFSGNNSREFIPPHAGKQTNISLQRKSNLHHFNRHPLINRKEYVNLLPSCPYSPSFLVRRKLQRFEGAAGWLAQESHVFPQDDTDMIKSTFRPYWTKPNALVDKNRVESVVNKFVYSLRSR